MCEITRNEWDALNTRVNNLSRDVYAMDETLRTLCKDEKALSDRFNNTLMDVKVSLTALQERARSQAIGMWAVSGGIVLIIILLLAKV